MRLNWLLHVCKNDDPRNTFFYAHTVEAVFPLVFLE